MPLVPSTDRLTQEPGSEYLHVAVKFIDERVVGNIARQYHACRRACRCRCLGRAGRASVPLIDSRGVILGYIGWTPDRPGLTLIRKTGPALLGGAPARRRRAVVPAATAAPRIERAAVEPGPCAVPRLPRPADRPAQPRIVRGPAEARPASARSANTAGSRCSTSTSTASRPSTTRSAIRPATSWSRQTARRLESRVREVDTVARLGGDEFAIVLVDIRNVGVAEDSRAPSCCEDLSRPFMPDGRPGVHRRQHRHRDIAGHRRRIPTTCCARPTSRSTRRRRTAAAATSSSPATWTTS